MNKVVLRLAEQVLAGQLLDRADAEALAAAGGDDLYDLFYWANRIRIRFMGEKIRFCAIAAAKVGGCSEDCRFCAQSARHQLKPAPAVRLDDEQILKAAAQAVEIGADSFGIVNSGRGPTWPELRWMAPMLRQISESGGTRACVSLGTLSAEMIGFLRDCGVRRVHHNLETSRRHYPSIITAHTYEQRLETLRLAKSAGMSLCSGGIFGMGENWADRIDMALDLRALGVDVVPINFLNPIAGTPLANQPKLAPMECLKIISIYRFLLPRTDLKVAGGREVCLRDLQSWIFFAGASATMIGNYLTTCGRSTEIDHQMVRDLGLAWETYAEGGSTEVGAEVCEQGVRLVPERQCAVEPGPPLAP